MTVTSRVWVCVNCGATWELPLDEGPRHRDAHRSVYCGPCWRDRARVEQLGQLDPPGSPRGGPR